MGIISKIFGQKDETEALFWGCGIKVFIFIMPRLQNDTPLQAISKMKVLTENFYPIEVGGHDKFENGMFIKIYCPAAKFTLLNKKENIEMVYSSIYNHLIDGIKVILNRYEYKMLQYSFETIYPLPPKESPYIIPKFQLETITMRNLDTTDTPAGEPVGDQILIQVHEAFDNWTDKPPSDAISPYPKPPKGT